jgi:hypothetical protein
MLKTMVAFIKKRIKKSTISAINLWAKDGITYSLPANLKKKKKKEGKFITSHGSGNTSQLMKGKSKSRYNSIFKNFTIMHQLLALFS